MSIREKFSNKFGSVETRRLEEAATEHANGVNSENKGKDHFKWVLLICIGYQCFEIDRYREYHKIETPYKELKSWIKDNAELETHNGSCDYLSLMSGAYNEYMKGAK